MAYDSGRICQGQLDHTTPKLLKSVPFYTTIRRPGKAEEHDNGHAVLDVCLDRVHVPPDICNRTGLLLERPSAPSRDGNSTSDVDLLDAMHSLLNYEIVEQGNSYPFDRALSFTEFIQYYAAADLFALRIVSERREPSLAQNCAVGDMTGAAYTFGCRLVGSFYVKPNYPSRSAHVCNGGFLVVPAFRGCGVGTLLGSRYPLVAQELGYRASIFNLVYSDNVASVRLWKKLGYTHLSTIPGGGRVLSSVNSVEGERQKVRKEIVCDALQFYLDLEEYCQAHAAEATAQN